MAIPTGHDPRALSAGAAARSHHAAAGLAPAWPEIAAGTHAELVEITLHECGWMFRVYAYWIAEARTIVDRLCGEGAGVSWTHYLGAAPS